MSRSSLFPLFFCFLFSSCTIESFSFGDTPEPTIIVVSPQVAAPGQRIIIVGQNFELTPDDPNDLPGSDRPTPYSIEVFINEKLIPFQSGDSISTGFLTIRLPNLSPDRYTVVVVVNGKTSNTAAFFVDTITSIEFSQDPIILSGVGQAVPLTVFGNRFDDEQIDVTNDVTFEVNPPGALSIGLSGFMAGLSPGTATLAAHKGLLSDTITVSVLGEESVISLDAPVFVTVPVGDSAILTLDGLTDRGNIVSLEAVSTLQIDGDEQAIPIERNEQGQPVVTALQPTKANITFTVGDGSLGSVSTRVIVQP